MAEKTIKERIDFMCKKNTAPKAEISRIIWSNIRKAQYLNCLTDEQLADALGVSTRTLTNYDDNPDVMTLSTLQLFMKNMSMMMCELTAV